MKTDSRSVCFLWTPVTFSVTSSKGCRVCHKMGEEIVLYCKGEKSSEEQVLE